MWSLAFVVLFAVFIPKTAFAQFGAFSGAIDTATRVKKTHDNVKNTKKKIQKTKKDLENRVQKIKNLPQNIANDFRNAARWEYEKGRYLCSKFKRLFATKRGASAKQRQQATRDIYKAERAYSAHHGREAARRWAKKMRRALAKLSRKYSPKVMKKRALASAKRQAKKRLTQEVDSPLAGFMGH